MSTHAVVGFLDGDDFRGVYVHFDGDSLKPDLETLVRRDGPEKVRETILSGVSGWSFIDHEAAAPYSGAGVLRPGYGASYAIEPGDKLLTDLSSARWEAGAEYVWVIEPEGNVELLP